MSHTECSSRTTFTGRTLYIFFSLFLIAPAVSFLLWISFFQFSRNVICKKQLNFISSNFASSVINASSRLSLAHWQLHAITVTTPCHLDWWMDWDMGVGYKVISTNCWWRLHNRKITWSISLVGRYSSNSHNNYMYY